MFLVQCGYIKKKPWQLSVGIYYLFIISSHLYYLGRIFFFVLPIFIFIIHFVFTPSLPSISCSLSPFSLSTFSIFYFSHSLPILSVTLSRLISPSLSLLYIIYLYLSISLCFLSLSLSRSLSPLLFLFNNCKIPTA